MSRVRIVTRRKLVPLLGNLVVVRMIFPKGRASGARSMRDLLAGMKLRNIRSMRLVRTKDKLVLKIICPKLLSDSLVHLAESWFVSVRVVPHRIKNGSANR